MNGEQFWAVEMTAFVAIVVMCILIYTLRQNTLMLKRLCTNDDSDIKTAVRFNGEQAEGWFEQGELKKLEHYCKDFIEQSPNSVHAHWFYALSKFNQGDYELAQEYFENVIHINPLWRDGAIVYLQEISERARLPNSRTIH